MRTAFTKRRKSHRGFSLLEMMFATIILLVGLVAIAQLVPASILLNNRNRMDSSALVLAQRELDFIIDQPLVSTNFTDPNGVYCPLGNICNLGTPAPPNQVQGSPVVVIANRPTINFSAAAVGGWSFTTPVDVEDPYGAQYDVRWAAIMDGTGATASSRRIIISARLLGGNRYGLPLTLDAMVQQ